MNTENNQQHKTIVLDPLYRTAKVGVFLLLVLFALGITFMVPGAANAETYYLDSFNGSDSNPGTSDAPWRTFDRALPDYSGSGPGVSGGDTVIVRGGNYGSVNYSENGDTGRSDWIRYRAADTGDRPVISYLSIQDTANAYLEWNGFHFDAPSGVYATIYIEGTDSVPASRVRIVNSIVERPAEPGQKVNTIRPRRTAYITIDNCEIIHGTVSVAYTDYLTITNNAIHDSPGDGIDIGICQNVVIENNTIYNIDPWDAGAHIDAMSIADCSNVQVRRNRLWEIHGQGIYTINDYGSDCYDITVENNLIYGEVHSGMLKFYNAHNLVLRNNTAILKGDFYGTGVQSSCTNVQVYGNIITGGYHISSPSSTTSRGYNIFTSYDSTNGLGQGSIELSASGMDIRDVGFVDYSGNDYHLLSNSMAVDFIPSGMAPSKDAENNTRIDVPGVGSSTYIADGGCYEYFMEVSDTTAPEIESVTANRYSLQVNFNEQVESSTAQNVQNYSVNNGIIIDAATLNDNLNSVILDTSEHLANTDYTLTVSGVEDVSANVLTRATINYQFNNGLVSHWKLDETTGTTAADSAGSNNGTLFNGPVWNTGKFNNAIEMQSTDQGIRIGTQGITADQGTISLWANAAQLPDATQFMFGHVQGGWGNRIQIYTNTTTGSLGIGLGDNHQLDTNICDLELNRWYQIVLTWDTGSYVVYVDGVQQSSGSYSGLNTLQSYAHIGNTGYEGDNSEAFLGKIDDVRVFNRALNDQEVSSLFSQEIPYAFAPIGPKEISENSTLEFQIKTSNPDISLSIYDHNLPSTPTLNNNIFTWTPSFQAAGQYQITFGAWNGEIEDIETISITVNNTNRAPMIEPLSDVTVPVGKNILLEVIATDPDGDTVDTGVSALPAGAGFDNNVFAWKPQAGQEGIYTVTFGATDGQLTNSENVTITVTEAGNPPVIKPLSDQNVDEGDMLGFTIEADDPDSEALTYWVQPLPAGAHLVHDVFFWEPKYGQAGNYSVTFYVSDGQYADLQTVNITVRQVNTAPVVEPISNKVVDEQGILTFPIIAKDAEGNDLSFTSPNLPETAVLTGNGFTWRPGLDQQGVYDLIFTVSDGMESASQSVTITVNNVEVPDWFVEWLNRMGLQ